MKKTPDLEDTIRQMKPLIILGMHRSGTSLLARLLKQMGIHMGNQLSRDAEAVFFQKINRKIYRSAGSNWGVIDRLVPLMNADDFVKIHTDKTLGTLFPLAGIPAFNQGIYEFFGPVLWDKLIHQEPIWWGWKDPRTTLTFPIWLKVFPQARFVHILRNGVDVAISIHRRSIKQSRKLWKRVLPIDYIPKTLDFVYCFRLWEMHVSYLNQKKELIPPDQYCEIRYEDLLSDPSRILQTVTEFVEYPLRQEDLDIACRQIDNSRLQNTGFARVYQSSIRSLMDSPWMKKYDYQYPIATEM